MKLIISMLVLLLSCVGCGHTPPKESIKYIFVSVPKEMTKRVSLTPPPNPVYYSALPWNTLNGANSQEGELIALIQKHTTTIGVCNARIQSIENWSTNQAVIYNTVP